MSTMDEIKARWWAPPVKCLRCGHAGDDIIAYGPNDAPTCKGCAADMAQDAADAYELERDDYWPERDEP